jgi:serine/threonine-protein kinase
MRTAHAKGGAGSKSSLSPSAATQASSHSGVVRSTSLCDGLVPGAVVVRRFRADRLIASGSMGEVWAGYDMRLKLNVAMKILRRKAQANHEIVARFSREAFLLGKIQTDRVARIYDFVARGRYAPVLVMELIEGPCLAQVVSTTQLAVEDAIDLGVDLAKALRELHAAKVVHRDLKPANVMLRPRPEGEYRAVFVDLGVSRMLSDEALDDCDQLTEITTADRCVGTIEYMAPEQILSSRTAKPVVDLYAVGAILFRAVAGHNVFGDLRGVDLARKKLSEAPPALDTGRSDIVARGFEDALARALSPSPDDRFEDAEELLAELSRLRDAACRGGVARSATRPSLLPRSTKLLWAAAAIALLGAGTVLGASALRRSAPWSAPMVDADQCRVVGHRIENPPRPGVRNVLLSISCPEPDAPR